MMKHVKRKLTEKSRQRHKLVRRFYRFLDEVEGRPSSPKPVSSFPFNIPERLIIWMLTTLERWVERKVGTALMKLDARRKR